MRNLFKKTFIWEKLRDKWVFDIMTTGKTTLPSWLVAFMFESEE